MRLQDLHAALHGPGGDQHLGHEVLALLEALAHFPHGGDHAFVEDHGRVYTGLQGGLDGLFRFRGFAFQD